MAYNHKKTLVQLLAYPNTTGLCDTEVQWRNFARWLLRRIYNNNTATIQKWFKEELNRKQRASRWRKKL